MTEIERFPYSLPITKKEKRLLVELICDEQSKMIIADNMSYKSNKYKTLENLKVKIKYTEVI